MFAAIKSYFQKRALDSLREYVQQNRKRQFTPLDRVKTMLVLYKANSEGDLSALMSFMASFRIKGIVVDAIAINRHHDEKKQPSVIDGCHLLSYKSIRWNGVPKNDEILKLLQNSHDYFIDLTRLESSLSVYLATASLAKFKIGGVTPALNPFDFTIETGSNSDIGYFEEQMVAYLQKLG